MTQADIQSLFFLTMKTTGKVAAKDAIENLDPNKELATVFLSAKHRLCLNEDTVCDGEFCPYAKDYFSKRQAIREQLFSRQHWHDDALKKLGTDHQICPYYLSQDWAVWADIIVGDINYIYDTTAVQPYLLKEINNRATVLIDESHNLIDRGRMIYSAEFDGNSIQQLLKETPKAIQKKLRKIQSKMRKVCQEHDAQLSTHLPNSFCQALKDFIAQSPVLLRESPQYTPTDDWQNFIFSCARFSRLNELANTVDFRWRYHDGKPHERRIELLCLSPSKLLEDKHNLVNNVVAFSATLKPWKYSNQLNGLPTAVISELPSPFQPQQYQVYIANDVSTRYRDRVDLPKQLINTLEKVTKSDKNSMVFFSSYQQLNNCTKALPESDTTLIQQSDWTNEMRDKVLAQFKNERGITLMTVLGGVFSEGIDLPGSQLETVVIVGPGLPQVNDVNNAIKDRMNQQQFPGFDFAYVFPGIQKVLQAAGRCVRSEQDNGHILLIDDRFLEYQRQQWLPSFWEIKSGPLNLWNCVS
jgi:DNA excision repair protein ERCC-2